MHAAVRAAMIVMAIFGFCLVGASTPLWVGHTWVNGVDCGSVVDESTEREAVARAAYDHSEWEGEKPLRRLFAQHGIVPVAASSASLVDDTHPCIAIDMSRCIDCFRCVRICDEVQGQSACRIAERGSDTTVFP